ncbi:MAG: hypothetical protein ACYS5V_16445, partial [Planctomycetota bacterium]
MKRVRATVVWAGVVSLLVLAAVLGGGYPHDDSGGPLRVVVFVSPRCLECRDVLDALPAIERTWGRRLQVERKDMTELQAFADLSTYEDHYGVEVKAPPAVFVGGRALIGAETILRELDGA